MPCLSCAAGGKVCKCSSESELDTGINGTGKDGEKTTVTQESLRDLFLCHDALPLAVARALAP